MKQIIYIILLLVMVSSCFAASIGISPSKIRFNDILSGGYAQRSVKITTDFTENLTAHFTVSGDIEDWLKLEPNNTQITLSASRPYQLKVILTPPEDIGTGNYSGKVDFVTDYLGSPTGRAGGFIKAAVSLIIQVEINNNEIISCSAGGFNFKDIEIGYPMELAYTVHNTGNIRLAPVVKYDIWDQLQEEILISDQFTGNEILPTEEESFTNVVSVNELGIGQYWAKMAIDECGASRWLSFSIVEKGGIVDKGVLEKVQGKVWAYVNEPIEIVATFKNIGPRIVTARFQGNIKDDNGKILEVIETDEIDVNSNEEVDFTHVFTPPKQGRFEVNGRVIYNKKLTFEQGTIINVKPNEEVKAKPNYTLLFVYLIIIVTIVYLARKIYKSKKR